MSTKLAITNKAIIGKTGLFSTKTMNSPLNKVQNVSVKQSLFGKLFHYGTLVMTTASGNYKFAAVAKANDFKTKLMTQVDEYENDKIKQQASEMARAISSAK